MAYYQNSAYQEQQYQQAPLPHGRHPQYHPQQVQQYDSRPQYREQRDHEFYEQQNGTHYTNQQYAAVDGSGPGRPQQSRQRSGGKYREEYDQSNLQQYPAAIPNHTYDDRYRTSGRGTPQYAPAQPGIDSRRSPPQQRPGTATSNRTFKRERILKDEPESPKNVAWDNPFGVFPGSKKDLENKNRRSGEHTRSRAATPADRPGSSASRSRTREPRDRATTPAGTRRPLGDQEPIPQFRPQQQQQQQQQVPIPVPPSQSAMLPPARPSRGQEMPDTSKVRASLEHDRVMTSKYVVAQERPMPRRAVTGPTPEQSLILPTEPVPRHDLPQPQEIWKPLHTPAIQKRASEDAPQLVERSYSASHTNDIYDLNAPQEPLVLTKSNQTAHSLDQYGRRKELPRTGAHDPNAYRGVPVPNHRPSGASDNPLPNFGAMSVSSDKLEKELTMQAPTAYRKPVYGQAAPRPSPAEIRTQNMAAVSPHPNNIQSPLADFAFELPSPVGNEDSLRSMHQQRQNINPDYKDTSGHRDHVQSPNSILPEMQPQYPPRKTSYNEVGQMSQNYRPPASDSDHRGGQLQHYERPHKQQIAPTYQSYPQHQGYNDQYGHENRAMEEQVARDPVPLAGTHQEQQYMYNNRLDRSHEAHSQHASSLHQAQMEPQYYDDERGYQDYYEEQNYDQSAGPTGSQQFPSRADGYEYAAPSARPYNDQHNRDYSPSGLPVRPRTANSTQRPPPPTQHSQVPPLVAGQSTVSHANERMHPPPFRPGLAPSSSMQAPVAMPDARQYSSTPPPLPSQSQNNLAPPKQSLPLSSEPPVTKAELNHLQDQFRNNPNNHALGLKFAKRLVEAARTLASENGTADVKVAARNRERYIDDAYKTVKKLVAAGYPEAMFFLADCHGTGRLGLAVDPSEAFKLYQSAAKLGHAGACYRVAVCCEIGTQGGGGTKRDHARAVQFYKRSATLGDGPAMYKMGMIMLKGLLGQQPNPREGVTWLKRAAERADEENPHALHELGILYETAGPTSIVIKDEGYAYQLYLQAAQLNYKHSQWRLGSAYEYGTLTCRIDPRESIAWYSRAAKQNEHQSEFALSGWYLTGSPPLLEQSDTEAYLWARKAASSGLVKAEYAMGYYTETGIGVKSDLEEAKKWYFRAAAQGDQRARNRLEEIKRGGKRRERTKVSRKDVGRQNEGECVVM